MAKDVILTGLRANNDLHLGNYLGALLPMVDMANKQAGKYQINLFVPDLHSFTTPIDHSTLHAQTLQTLKFFAAAGLDFSKPDTFIYRQSYIPAHSELTWILDCFAGFGEMSRMTQFKDKSSKLSHDRISVGLFNYPALMAADILLYSANYVPVGEDQTQHLEFTRDLAERMNKQFGKLFTEPEPVAKQHQFFGNDQGLRIHDLADPTKKMSKSNQSSKGVIFLNDEPKVAMEKIRAARTDSLGKIRHDFKKQPGVTTLMQILGLVTDRPKADIVAEYEGQPQYGPLKEATAKAVADFLTDFQAKLKAVDEKALFKKLEASEAAMNEVANATLLKVQKAVGLRPL